MSSKVIIGLMGPGESATPEQNEMAYELGAAIAREGWVLLTGGREFGVMEAAMKGASDNKGLTIGILPGETPQGASEYAHLKILTGLGSARNNINVLSSHAIVVLGMAAGTASEVALAVKANKKVILLGQSELTINFFKSIGTYRVIAVNTVKETIDLLRDYVALKQIR
jgi:uncharacterized protein (TIGR00725 family)